MAAKLSLPVMRKSTVFSHGFESWPELEVQVKALIVDKTRFGAFVPGSSGLHDILQAGGIDTLITKGVPPALPGWQ
jgi:REP element-mobilizing transposase RayT